MPEKSSQVVDNDEPQQEALTKRNLVKVPEKLLDRIEVLEISQRLGTAFSITRFSYRKNTSGQMHWHPKGTEVLVGIEGLIFVHFLKDNNVKCLKPGDHLTITSGPEHAHRVFSAGRPAIFLLILDDYAAVVCEVQEESWLT